jgi:hypothetical protein
MYLAVWYEQAEDAFQRVIHAGRLDATGASLDFSPLPITASPNSFLLDLGFNGTDFVVLWATPQASNAYSVRVTRISPTGGVKDPTGIELGEGGGMMACAASECLVVLANDPNLTYPPTPQTMRAARVAASGVLDSPPLKVLDNAGPQMLLSRAGGYLLRFATRSPMQRFISKTCASRFPNGRSIAKRQPLRGATKRSPR